MELANKKGNLNIFYDMCSREAEIAKRNIDVYIKKANVVFHNVITALENSYGTENCLISYDSALTDLSQLSDMLRKFNLKFELTPIFPNVPSDIEPSSVKGNVKEQEKEKEKEEKKEEETPIERFTYPHSNISKYKINYEGDCVITYVKDSGELLFYINETGNTDYTDCIENLQNYFQESPSTFSNVPNEGEVFGLHLEGYMFRAVRENGPVSPNSFNAYLVDIGEVINITQEMELYVLPLTLQNVYSQAILCKLISVNFDSDIDLKTYLSQNLYVKQSFIVANKDDSLLYLDLRGNTNPFRDANGHLTKVVDIQKESLSKPITNPFRKYFCVKTQFDNVSEDGRSSISKRVIVEEHHAVVNNCEDNISHNSQAPGHSDYVNFNQNNSRRSSSQNINLKDFLECDSNYSDDSLCSARTTTKSNKSNKTELNRPTEDEIRVLYEEPLNTTNAMKAVMGYEPKDDKRICQFYNSQTESCFKGTNCRFEHIEKNKHGWTRDEAETIIDIPNKIVYPATGQTITMKPTHIINVELFFAQIVHYENKYRPTLKELILKMNSPEETLTHKKLKTMPVRFELVLAKFKDGMWYRAKVLNIIDDETLKVFYVDYGNSDVVTLSMIRKWQCKFDYLPFQAVSCRLAGVKERRLKSLEGAEYLRKLILNKAVKANVINNVDQLQVKLTDGVGTDVAEELIKLGFAEIQPIYDNVHQGQWLPA